MSYVAALALATLLAFALTPAVRILAVRLGALDQPGPRKVHATATPRLGGLVLALAGALTIAALDLFAALPDPAGALVTAAWRPLLGVPVILAVGLWDDFRAMPAPVKLLGQSVAAAIAIAFGARVEHVTFLGAVVPLGPLALPLTFLWIVILTNAFNLVDGLDGLATGLAVIAAATCAVIMIARNDAPNAMLLVVLLGAALGFLPYNWSPASIFLGDSGSLLFGYVLGVTAITGWQKGATALAVAAPMLIFALPLADAAFSVGRRLRASPVGFAALRAVLAADRRHLHHRLIEAGLSTRSAVLALYALALGLSLVALLTARVP